MSKRLIVSVARMSVAGDSEGNFTIVWSDVDLGPSYETRIFARRFDAEGQPLADPTQLRTTMDDNIWSRRPLIVMDDSGRSLISWNEGPQLFAPRLCRRRAAAHGHFSD